MRRVAIIGSGWAGLAAAVQAVSLGHTVTLYEMAARCGGRARRVDVDGLALDNGQHIMIGAYTELLRLMRIVGADPQRLLLRTPLALIDAAGTGLRLRAGHPALSFIRAVMNHASWPGRAKSALLVACLKWRLTGFRCSPTLTVADLCAGLPRVVRDELIDPLCVAALNTASEHASGRVFLRVLQDALMSGPGSSDLLIPQVDLGAVFPDPAAAWLAGRGATIRTSTRVLDVAPSGGGWTVDGTQFDAVVLATPPHEAARLAASLAPHWSGVALALRHEPIVTVYLHSPGARLEFPMLALRSSADQPAQFVFDRGQLGGRNGLLAFVISGAQAWVDAGMQATLDATAAQAQHCLGRALRAPLVPVHVLTEKRATFRCTPTLQRPSAQLAPGLWVAGDYVDGPYPATLEGAVRSGVQAARGVCTT